MKNNTSIILLLLAVGLFYTFTIAQYQEAKELQALSNEYRGVLKNAEAIAGLRDGLLATYATLPQEEIGRLNKALPDNIETVRLALDLDGIASRYGVSIKSINTTIGASEDPNLIVLPEYAGPYEKATVSFGFIASYQNFKNILADMEKSLRIMDIKSVSFKVNESSLYDYEIEVETYWLK